jgi:hypothetical protein
MLRRFADILTSIVIIGVLVVCFVGIWVCFSLLALFVAYIAIPMFSGAFGNTDTESVFTFTRFVISIGSALIVTILTSLVVWRLATLPVELWESSINAIVASNRRR